MYAVISSGGKQYRVSEGETLRVEKLAGGAGSKVTFGPLLFADDGGELEAACRKVIAANAAEAGNFKANPKLMGFFVGAVMKETGGKANPKAVNEILRKLLA